MELIMKKYCKLLLLAMAAMLAFVLLSSCTSGDEPDIMENEQVYEQYDAPFAEKSADNGEDISTNDDTDITVTTAVNTTNGTNQVDILAETDSPEGIGGDDGACEQHVYFFYDFSMFTWPGIITREELRAWSHPLWEIQRQTGECLINMSSFIQYFGISRELFQEIVDSHVSDYFRFGGENIDVLYSGDVALINQFFAQEGPAAQMYVERQNRYFSDRIMEAQRLVNENTTEMSWYFHDIWTYTLLPFAKDSRYSWMRGLIDAGEYDRVNIVEFIYHFGLYRPSSLSPGLTIFEHWATYHNMNIFTHYNFDVLLSGDWDLIREYYGIANEPYLTAQVQARFDAYVAANGYVPDTSWMIDRTPVEITINPATATVQTGGQRLFSATVSGPNNTPQAVTWYVQGFASGDTTITEAGLLHVAQDETATTLTVRATLDANTSIYATATVTVTAPSHSEPDDNDYTPGTPTPTETLIYTQQNLTIKNQIHNHTKTPLYSGVCCNH